MRHPLKRIRCYLRQDDKLRRTRMPWARKLYPDPTTGFIWQAWSPFAKIRHWKYEYPWFVSRHRKRWAWTTRGKKFTD